MHIIILLCATELYTNLDKLINHTLKYMLGCRAVICLSPGTVHLLSIVSSQILHCQTEGHTGAKGEARAPWLGHENWFQSCGSGGHYTTPAGGQPYQSCCLSNTQEKVRWLYKFSPLQVTRWPF